MLRLIPFRLGYLLVGEDLQFSSHATHKREYLDRLLPEWYRLDLYSYFYPGLVWIATVYKTLLIAGLLFIWFLILRILSSWRGLSFGAIAAWLRRHAIFLAPHFLIAINLAVISLTVGHHRYFFLFYSPLIMAILSAPTLVNLCRTHGNHVWRLPVKIHCPSYIWATTGLFMAAWAFVMVRYSFFL